MQHRSPAPSSLLEGSVPLGLLAFALPLFMGQVLQQFYNMADAWVIGNFAGNDEFAAVSAGGNLIFMITGFTAGIATGGGVVIARYFGAGDRKNLQEAMQTNFLFGLVAGGAATAVGLLAVPPLLVWMRTPESVLPHSLAYFRIYFGGAFTIVLYNICTSMMQALGDSRRPLYYLLVSTGINVLLDLLFVAVLHWGAAGAAAATVLAQGFSVLLCLRRLTSLRLAELRLELGKLRWNTVILGQILRQGLPTGVQNTVISLGNLVIQSNINSFGAFAMSGHGAYSRIEGFAFLSITSMSMALPTFVSQNLGAARIDRAKQCAAFGILFTSAAAALTGAVIYRWIPRLLLIFVDSPEAIRFGVTHARIVCGFYALLAFAHCCAGVLRGCGKAAAPMVIMLAIWCGLRSVYVTVILKFIREFGMISWAYPLTWSISCTLFLTYLLRLDWKKLGSPL